MADYDLRAGQVLFEGRMEEVLTSRKDLHKLRKDFVQYYSIDRVKNMSLDQYAIGRKVPTKNGFHFCKTLERGLDGLGRIIGSTSFKFGIYYGVTKSDKTIQYRYTQKFGGTDQATVFENIKLAIIALINAGHEGDIHELVRSPISTMFKGKILSTYYPERYLNVFSEEHLDHFLAHLGLDIDASKRDDAVVKRERLRDFKNQDQVMRHWSLDLFSYFLYNIYPGPPSGRHHKEREKDFLDDFRPPAFPAFPTPEWVDLSILTQDIREKNENSFIPTKNPDYEKIGRKLKAYGNRGEDIVLAMEKERLRTLNKPKLAAKIKKVQFDYYGYDILSFDETNVPRYIEVKATSSKVGPVDFFLSLNELNKARELPNYYIYIVFDILSSSPKVWMISNPFNPENPDVSKIPVSYKVSINAQ